MLFAFFWEFNKQESRSKTNSRNSVWVKEPPSPKKNKLKDNVLNLWLCHLLKKKRKWIVSAHSCFLWFRHLNYKPEFSHDLPAYFSCNCISRAPVSLLVLFFGITDLYKYTILFKHIWFQDYFEFIFLPPKFWLFYEFIILFGREGYYWGWPDSSGCFFSWVFLILDWAHPGPMRTQVLRAPKQADWLKTNHTIGLVFSLAQGEPSQIWEILKRKSSHLNLVTLDNTFIFAFHSS